MRLTFPGYLDPRQPDAPMWNAFVRRRRGLLMGAALVLSAASLMAQTSGGPRQWQTPPAGDAVKGQALYAARCAACHAVDSSKVGPAHRGVMGRRVGSLKGYKYSDELAQSRLRWTPHNHELKLLTRNLSFNYYGQS